MRFYFEDFELDLDRCELRRNGQVVHLDPKPLRTLSYLVQNRHRVVSPSELLTEVWRVQRISDSAIPTTIRTIRLALGDDAVGQRLVQTLPRHGYRFRCPVEVHYALPKAHRGRPPLVGRKYEEHLLQSALERSVHGEPRLLAISGDPGIGKTRLIEELAALAVQYGADVLLGRCREEPGAPAYWPWTQIIRAYIDTKPKPTVRDRMGPFAPILAQMVPEIPRLIETPKPNILSLDPPQERFRLFDNVVRFLGSASSHVPLVLLFDDLHQSDLSSLMLLDFVANHLRKERILIAAAYRDGELWNDAARAVYIRHLTSIPLTLNLEVRSLTLQAVSTFVEIRMPDVTETQKVASLLYEQSGGNPFFIVQLLDLLQTRMHEGKALQESLSPLPARLRDLIAAQVAILPATSSEALRLASALGRDIDLDLLSCLVDKPLSATLDLLAPAFRAGLLLEVNGKPSTARFSHILLRNALYEELPLSVRSSLHLRIAALMESRLAGQVDSFAPELAYHFRQGSDWDRTIEYSLRAAHLATSRLAYEDARLHCREALDALDNAPPHNHARRPSILLELAQAELRAGDRDAAHTWLKETARLARLANRPDLLARAALALAPDFFALEVGVVDETLIALLEEALVGLPGEELALRAQLMARLALALSYSDGAERSVRLSEDAVDLAEQARDPSTWTYVLTARHPLLWGPTRTEDRLRSADRIIQVGTEAGLHDLVLVHRLFRLTDLLELGEIPAADEEIAAFNGQADRLQIPQAQWYKALFAAMRCYMRGNVDKVEVLAHEVLRQGQRVGDRNATLSFLVLLEGVRVEQGRFAELVPMIDAVRAQFPALDIPWRCATAWGLAENRLASDARRHVERIDPDAIPRGILGLVSHVLLGTAGALVGDRDLCERLYSYLEPHASRCAVVGYSVVCLGSISRTLGMLAASLEKWERARAHFEVALETNHRIGSPLWTARATYDYACALTASGESSSRVQARSLAQSSLTIASRLNLTNLASNSRRLLRTIQAGRPVPFHPSA